MRVQDLLRRDHSRDNDDFGEAIDRYVNSALERWAFGTQQKPIADLPDQTIREIAHALLSDDEVSALVSSPGFEDLTPQERAMRREAVRATLVAVVRKHGSVVQTGPMEKSYKEVKRENEYNAIETEIEEIRLVPVALSIHGTCKLKLKEE